MFRHVLQYPPPFPSARARLYPRGLAAEGDEFLCYPLRDRDMWRSIESKGARIIIYFCDTLQLNISLFPPCFQLTFPLYCAEGDLSLVRIVARRAAAGLPIKARSAFVVILWRHYLF